MVRRTTGPMLYQFHQWQRALLSPFVESSHFAAQLLKDVPGGRSMAASLELFNRVGREYPKPLWALPKVEQVVAEKPFCRLLRFEGTGPKVLLFAPLSGHYATLLRETVRGLMAEHDVYVTDWANARDVPLSAGKWPTPSTSCASSGPTRTSWRCVSRRCRCWRRWR